MTSNIPGGRAGAETHFKPEFINRLDDIVEFESLTREQIGEIVGLQVENVIKRVAERGIALELTDDARTLLGNLGYDPTYGAPAQARDPEAARRPAGDRAARGPVQGRRHGPRRQRRRRTRARPSSRNHPSPGGGGLVANPETVADNVTNSIDGRAVEHAAGVKLQAPDTVAGFTGNSRRLGVDAIVPQGPDARPRNNVRTASPVG